MPTPQNDLDALSADFKRRTEELTRQIDEQTQTQLTTDGLLKRIEELRRRIERTSGAVPDVPDVGSRR